MTFKTLSAALAILGFALASVAFAESERVAYPKDYQTSMENYLSLDRTLNDDQVIRLFASKEALAAAKAGKELPNGTVLVAEVYKAKKDKDGNVIESSLGRRVRDKFAAVAVMEKRAGWGDTIPEDLRNGDWDFAIFSPKGERLAKKDLNKCRSCHAPLKATQHLFSLEHMTR
ncbi:MAG: cytochrome P460 family protein [Hyphomicrobiaceae bacterium]